MVLHKISHAEMLLLAILVIGVAADSKEGRWSRQLSEEVTANSDWVPMSSAIPNKRQATPRVLNQPAPFQSSFFPADTFSSDYIPQEAPRQLFLQSVPAGPQAYNSEPLQLTLTNRYNPLAQAFAPPPPPPSLKYSQNAPQFYQPQPQFVQNPSVFNNQLYNPVVKSQQQIPANKPNPPPLAEAPRVESNLNVQEVQKPLNPVPSTASTLKATERSSSFAYGPTTPAGTTVEKEEVQLLYVPLETLQSDKFDMKDFLKKSQKESPFFRDSMGSSGQIINNQLYAPTTPNYLQRQQSQLQNIQQDLLQQAYNAQTLQGKLRQNSFDRQPKYQQPLTSHGFPFSQVYPQPAVTTPKSKKLKAHQPPLAVYMIKKGQEKAKLTDVLSILKDSRSVAVLDTVSPNNPKVFVGPSTLRTPDNYAKFELPYLSSIDGHRIQKKIENLPFFVAPLSYKAPQGFAKIPFPAPHVGSVIINPYMQEPDFGKQTTFFDSRPATVTQSSFSQNPVTEQSNFGSSQNNFFSSVTSSPVSSQSNGLNFESAFSQLDQGHFGVFRPMPNNRKPEPVSNTLRPTTNYFSSTPVKPTVSYFSFAGPEYSTLPTTTHKPTSTLSVTDNRGHYITNAAIETSATPSRPTQTESTRPKTTQIPSTSPKYQTQSPYNQGFVLKNPYEPPGFQFGNIRQNEIRDNFPPIQQQVQVVNQQGFNSYSQVPQRPVTTSQRPLQDFRYSTTNQYSPKPYLNENLQTITDVSGPEQQEPDVLKTHEESFADIFNQFTHPTAEDVTDEIKYESERENQYPSTNEIVPTTSTTTTTQAPTTTTTETPPTRATRRPINRGRPRYTTPKSDDEDTIKVTTRRTPIRERRPPNYRTRTTTTTTEGTPVEESSNSNNNNFESAKKPSYERAKLPTRQPFRSRYQDEEDKTTTESSVVPSSTPLNRNQRLRGRGKAQFRPSSNDETDLVPKGKKEKGEANSIAYQRDILHQNYPVTLSERLTTLEVRTTPSYPSTQSLDTTKSKIRIYETTGSRQENNEGDAIYENQPIFEAEEEKYLTNPDAYVEVNNPSLGSTPSQNNYVSEEVVSDKTIYTSTARYEPEIISNTPETTRDYYSVNIQNSKAEEAEIETERVVNIDKKASYTSSTTPEPTEAVIESTTTTTSAPVVKFRKGLRQRPKLLSSLSTKQLVEESKSKSEQPKKNSEENIDNVPSTRRTFVQPVTYRPAYERRRTTMRIEEIEQDLKANRVQLRSKNQSTTRKYPVYVPEATTPRSASESPESDVTTRRNFVRRRPTRPTSAPASESSQSSVSEEQQPKRLKLRSRLRSRPTTTERIENEEITDQELKTTVEEQEKIPVTQKTLVQKYSSRNKLLPKYRRPQVTSERSPLANTENNDDQASFDSINRPEYVEYDPENGKSETQWSSKGGSDSFKPMFSPNSIVDGLKNDFGTKYSSQEVASEDADIITARNSYDDILVSVTPASNNYKIDQSKETTVNDIYFTTTESAKEEKLPDTASTFESVLEEVMRNLEAQDENEYNDGYSKSVMKHKGGEIGAIPPETETVPETTGFGFFEQAFFGTGSDVKKVNPTTTTETITTPKERIDIAEDRMFSTASDIQTTTTERQPRRRGVWRRIKVRPTHKDTLETAESQFYKGSNNELSTKDKNEYRKPLDKPEKITHESISKADEEFANMEIKKQVEPTSTEAPATASPGDMDLGTGSPDAILKDVLENIEMKKENETEEEDTPTTVNYRESEEVDARTTVPEIVTEAETEKYERETEPSFLDSTEIPLGIAMESDEENFTERDEESTAAEGSSFENTLGKLLSVMELPQEVVPVESTDEPVEDDSTLRPDMMTPAVDLLDPKNIVSTSFSTEVSHETEICFRGRCVKTKKDDLS